MGPGDLSKVLAGVPSRTDPRLLVGRETLDDAGVYLISDDVALVQTVDFFPPIVDDPFTFGQIAAANAMSDVYAMGGQPLTALNIVAFPTGDLPLEVLSEILRGGQDKVHEAGALTVGGHSVVDSELKYGLSVTGRAHPKFLLTNAGAAEGDVLVLTKPLGTGILTTAAKRGTIAEGALDVAIESMKTLNGAASRAAVAAGAKCATDITGFGMLGHALHVARASAVTLVIDRAAVPVFPGAREAWTAGARTAGAERNAAFVEDSVAWGSCTEEDRGILVDPQTSGGLLVALQELRVAKFLEKVAGSAVIGRVSARDAVAIRIE